MLLNDSGFCLSRSLSLSKRGGNGRPKKVTLGVDKIAVDLLKTQKLPAERETSVRQLQQQWPNT